MRQRFVSVTLAVLVLLVLGSIGAFRLINSTTEESDSSVSAAMPVAPLPPVAVAVASSSSSAKYSAPTKPNQPMTPTTRDRTSIATRLPTGGVGTIPDGMTKPLRTNGWWTGGTLETWPAPLFPWPLKGQFTVDGLTLWIPVGKRVQDRAVLAGDGDPLRIFGEDGATGAQPVSAGDWDVTFRLRDAVGPQFDATFTEGSPFTFIRSHMDTLSAALPDKASATPVTCSTTCGSALLITAPRSRYLLVSPIKDAFRVNGSIISMRFTQDQTQMTIAAVASNSDPAAYLASAMRPFTGTRAEYSVTAAQVTTTFRFPQETLMGVLPHQYISLVPPVGKVIGTFDTVHGPIRLIAGSTFRTALPRPSILPSLPPLKALQSDQSLVTQLRTDINATIPPAGDVYSGGKDVLRTAMLVELAGLLGNNDLRAQAVTKARAALGTFCTAGTEDTFSLAYDANAGGLIAFPPAFGSEHYNDHHFHYGYLIHAAAIVAMFDPALPGQYGDCVKLLMRDIASSNRADPSFPYLRYFDPYAGHSWAGGLTLFGDGNNQESVSEAAHAWYAMALYGRATGDVATENLGTWLYAQESQSERLYWLNNLPSADVLPANFPYPMLSIIWGGKADYATFFDGSDPAVRGIQFFPITTSLFSVLSRSVNSRLIAPIIGPAEKNIWKSGLSMIDAFYNPNAGIPADWPIDPAYSRTYVNYWQQAAKILGEPVASMGSCAGTVFSKNGKLTGAVYRFPRDPAQCSFTLNGRTVTLGSLVTGWNVRTW